MGVKISYAAAFVLQIFSFKLSGIKDYAFSHRRLVLNPGKNLLLANPPHVNIPFRPAMHSARHQLTSVLLG